MIEVDFLFIYELKQRELENICLLRYELEKRGYTVAILQKSNIINNKQQKPIYNSQVVVIPACYDNQALEYFTKKITKFKKVIDMQWEQVLTIQSENNMQSIRFISEIGKDIVHISWGERNQKRLVGMCGLAENKVKVTGHITLDFLRDELRNYYINREELFGIYNIPQDKKVCLFISSFSYVGLTDSRLQGLKQMTGTDTFKFSKLSTDSQKIILVWFEKTIKDNTDVIFIYRPHPAEHNNNNLNKFAEKYTNFRIIRDYSVKQWILTCDIIYTWFSTSIAEIYYSNKNCHILRPLEIPYDNDTILTKDALFTKNYNEFKKTLIIEEYSFPIKKEIINYSYNFNPKIASYLRICDVMEEVFHGKEYKLSNRQLKKTNINKEKIKVNLFKVLRKTYIYDIYLWLVQNDNVKLSFFEKRRKLRKESTKDAIVQQEQNIKEYQYNYSTEEEIKNIIDKFRTILERRSEIENEESTCNRC